ncbi:MAG TPA: hypothetical protein VE396_01000 [Xanthobacteraceae bacterium]|nr:hypothetical protein [Xanthobacteraceae bacterium]
MRADIAIRIYKLTQKIVGDVLRIVVDGECVSRPKVIQPVGACGRFRIGLVDLGAAEELAEKMRARCGITGPRLVAATFPVVTD